MDLLARIADGAARHLDALGLGSWSPEGDYAPDLTPVSVFRQPDQPDQQITLTPYLVDPQGHLVGLQVKCRSTTVDAVNELRGAVQAAFDRPLGMVLQPADEPPVQVGSAYLQSAVAGVQEDPAHRLETTHNTYLVVGLPSGDPADG